MIRPAHLPLVVGGAGLFAAMIGWVFEPVRFSHAWLAALSVWLEWPLGSLALLLVHALTGGRWGDAIRPALLRGVTTLPLLLPALLPLLVDLHALYPWSRAGMDTQDALYLNVPFFAGRGLIYLIVWFGLASAVIRAERAGQPLGRLAAPGLLLLALTVTFAAIDTTLSLAPGFDATAWGMIAAAGAALLALSVACLLRGLEADAGAVADLGRLLLALVILWAYLDAMQFLAVWQSDLPQGAAWYVRRSSGGWGAAAVVVGIGHVLLPAVLLLVPAIRRSRRGVLLVAAWLAAMEVVHAWWLVIPAAPGGFSWIDIAAVLAFGGFAVALSRRGAGVALVHA